jgi:hypothetical protein
VGTARQLSACGTHRVDVGRERPQRHHLPRVFDHLGIRQLPFLSTQSAHDQVADENQQEENRDKGVYYMSHRMLQRGGGVCG